MPRLTRAQKDARKAREEVLKASQNSNDENNTTTSQAAASQQDSALHCNACDSTSHSTPGGEPQALTAGGKKIAVLLVENNTTTSQAATSQQDSALHCDACCSTSHSTPGGEPQALTSGGKKIAVLVVENNTTTSQAATSQQDSDLHCNACGSTSHIIPGGEPQALTAGLKKVGELVVENNMAEVIQVERDEKYLAETAKDGTNVLKRGSSNKSGEESLRLQPSQVETRQKQRVAGSSLAGNKGFSEGRNIGFNDKNSGQCKGHTGEDSRRGGGQQETYQSVGRGRGGNYAYGSRGGSCGFGSQGGRDDSRRIDALGRALSSVLRHRAVGLGLKVRSDGYVAVKDLLSLSTKTMVGLPLHSHSVDNLKEAVKRDNKQRFGLHEENGQLLIRANQGHSIRMINSVDLLNPIVSPEEVPVCVHGTYLRYLESIKREGLKRMNRNHIHFATGLCKEDGVISGMRSSCEVFIYLNVQKASKDGMTLYRSENGVILTEGFDGVVPPEYFANIERRGQKRNKMFE